MTTPSNGPQSDVPGGQPPPPPGYGPPNQGTQPPPPPGYGPPQGQPPAPGQAGRAQQWGQAADQPPATSHKKTWIALGVAGVLGLTLCGGGALFAFSKLSGGGPQPETALPATSIGFAKIDLDPSADQKVDAIRFLNKFPGLEEDMKDVDEDADLRKSIFDGIKEDGGLEGVDYEEDVEPWLGERFGVAMLPPAGGGDPEGVIALASTDQEAAEEGLAKIADGDGYCSVQEDYAICGEEKSVVDQAVEDAKENPLSEDEHFTADMDDLGEDGIVTGWFDAGKAEEIDPSLASAETQGRITAALRFDGPALELAGRVTDVPEEAIPSGDDGTSVEALPEDTVGALAIAGLDESITKGWPKLEDTLDDVVGPGWSQDLEQMETQTGVAVPEDIAKALGSDTVVAVGADPQNPQVAVRTNGDRGAIDDIVELVEQASQPQSYSGYSGYASPAAYSTGPQLTVREGDEGRVVVATDEGYAGEVADGSGLGDTDAFKDAVPDAGEAGLVGYVDVAQLVDTYGDELDEDERANLGALSAVGFSASGADGDASFSLRLTTK